MKPAPHAKCIVGIIARREIASRTDFAINIDEISRKIPYTAAGIKKKGSINNPRSSEVIVPRSVNGGARYLKFTVPG